MTKRLLPIAFLLASTATFAASEKMSQDDIDAAQSKLQQTFNQMKVDHFQPSPVEGLYEIYAGNNLLYFNPEQEVLFFGELYSKEGVSLTQQSKQARALNIINTLPMDSAITMGDPNGIEIIEIGQPECGYCQLADQKLNELAKKYPIKRKYFFLEVSSAQFPTSKKKVQHIICSEDKEEAYNAVSNKTAKKFKTCDDFQAIFARHQEVANGLGVNGTPTFLLGNRIVAGAQMDVVEQYLQEQMALRQ